MAFRKIVWPSGPKKIGCPVHERAVRKVHDLTNYIKIDNICDTITVRIYKGI